MTMGLESEREVKAVLSDAELAETLNYTRKTLRSWTFSLTVILCFNFQLYNPRYQFNCYAV